MTKPVAQTVESAQIHRKKPFLRRLDSLRHVIRLFFKGKDRVAARLETKSLSPI